MSANREMTRIELISNTPIVHANTECLNGITVLRAHKKEEDILLEYRKLMNENFSNQIMKTGVSCWFKLRIGLFSILLQIPIFLFSLWLNNSAANFAVM